jgi:hypothetical protein
VAALAAGKLPVFNRERRSGKLKRKRERQFGKQQTQPGKRGLRELGLPGRSAEDGTSQPVSGEVVLRLCLLMLARGASFGPAWDALSSSYCIDG